MEGEKGRGSVPEKKRGGETKKNVEKKKGTKHDHTAKDKGRKRKERERERLRDSEKE